MAIACNLAVGVADEVSCFHDYVDYGQKLALSLFYSLHIERANREK